jgi:hypothetical protein
VLIPNALLGEARPVNPGKHEVKAKSGSQMDSQEVNVDEGQRKSVVMRLAAQPVATPPPLPSTAPPEPAPANVAPAAPIQPVAMVATPAPAPVLAPTLVPAPQQSKPSSAQRTVGWVSLGIGGAGLLAGTVTGIMVLSKKSQLDSSGECAANRCLPSEHDTLSSLILQRSRLRARVSMVTAPYVFPRPDAPTTVLLALAAARPHPAVQSLVPQLVTRTISAFGPRPCRPVLAQWHRAVSSQRHNAPAN